MLNKSKVLMLQSAYDPEPHRAAVEAARKYNWHLDANLLNPMTPIEKWQGDGILCSLTDNPRFTEFIQRQTIPCVDLSTWREDIQIPRVSTDNNGIGRMAAHHFLAYRHRHFASFASAITPYGQDRHKSYATALAEHGHSVHPIAPMEEGDTDPIARQLKALPRPCAVFAQNDADAAWFASFCLKEGYQLPMDFAVLGVDNNPLICEVHSVPLSSIDRDSPGVVMEGARLLQLAMDNNPIPTTTTIIPPKGVITRASSDTFIIEDAVVRDALRHLQNHLAEKIGTPEIAAQLGISRSLLNQRFKDSTQTTLHQSLMNMRLTKAADLLIHTPWKMERIAAETGFTHASHLSNSFKRHFGKSPLSYRREGSG